MNTICLYCQYKATNHETIEEEKNPKEGDVSFCINCGEISLFHKGSLIKVNINDLDARTKTEIKRIEYAWLRTKKRYEFAKVGK